MLASIWRYREFIYSCVKREFQSKYKGSLFGAAWSVFQPLAIILVYTLIFSQIMKAKLAGMTNIPFAYSIYLCSGVLPWGLFSENLARLTNVFFAHADMMKKLSFPRICLPIIDTLSSLVNFLIAFSLFLLFLVFIGRFPLTLFWTFFIVLAVQTLFTVCIGIGFGVINVFFRDVGQMLNVVLQFWFWLTPVVYLPNILPQKFKIYLELNPMYYIINSYQNIFLFHKSPNFIALFGLVIISLLLGVWSLKMYRKHVGEMVDEL